MSLRCRLGFHRWSSWGVLSPDRHCLRCGKTEKTLSDFLRDAHIDGRITPNETGGSVEA